MSDIEDAIETEAILRTLIVALAKVAALASEMEKRASEQVGGYYGRAVSDDAGRIKETALSAIRKIAE